MAWSRQDGCKVLPSRPYRAGDGGIAVTEDRRGAIDSQDGAPRTTRGGERARVERTKASALWTAVALLLFALHDALCVVPSGTDRSPQNGGTSKRLEEAEMPGLPRLSLGSR